jgi:hypothetical protein
MSLRLTNDNENGWQVGELRNAGRNGIPTRRITNPPYAYFRRRIV